MCMDTMKGEKLNDWRLVSLYPGHIKSTYIGTAKGPSLYNIGNINYKHSSHRNTASLPSFVALQQLNRPPL